MGTVALPHAAHLAHPVGFAAHATAHPAGYTAAGAHVAGQTVVAAGTQVVGQTVSAPTVAQPAAYVGHQPAIITLPAPHVTSSKVPDVTTLHKPAPVITKEVHLGQTQYISGYATQILKPAIPDFKIAVPTALKGTVAHNPAVVTVQKEIHTVNEPVHVEKPYNVPYDVIKHVEKIVEVPTPVHVAKPVPVEHPYPVVGEPIIKKIQGAPVVRHHHTNVVAQPALAVAHAAPIAHAGLAYGHGLVGHGLAGLPH